MCAKAVRAHRLLGALTDILLLGSVLVAQLFSIAVVSALLQYLAQLALADRCVFLVLAFGMHLLITFLAKLDIALLAILQPG